MNKAEAEIAELRKKFAGWAKPYGVRYIRALAKACGYDVSESREAKVRIVVCLPLCEKAFVSLKEAGVWLEGTLRDRAAL